MEKTVETGRKEVKEYSWTKTIISCKPTGILEFRVGTTGYSPSRTFRDGKFKRLEDVVSKAVGAVMREARELGIEEEERRKAQIARQQQEKVRALLAEQIREEEKKVQQLETWVGLWSRANQMREFIAETEKTWAAQGHDLSPESAKGQRVAWMKQQADRLDPLIYDKPSSILDRKKELSGW